MKPLFWMLGVLAVAASAAAQPQLVSISGASGLPAADLPAPGTANVFTYAGCKDGRVVADVVRLEKGHTEGLEPNVTEALVKPMVSAKGGKLRQPQSSR